MSLSTRLYWVELPAGGKLAIAPRPRGGDWLNDEIEAWRKAGTDRVLSLLTPAEMRDTDLDAERAVCESHHVEFTNLPVEDRSVPQSDLDALAVIHSIAAGILRGSGVVIHCRQGIGRAPLIAISVLMELGMELDQAIALVSQSRGVPVPETEEQIDWLRHVAVYLNSAKVH
jgi:protein-tyrosine phosphatase